MKRITFLFIGLLFTSLIQAQESNDDYLTAKLSPGFPAKVSLFVENLPHVKSAKFETGIDSLEFLFGSYAEEDEQRFWAVVIKNKRRYYTSVPLQKSDSMGILSHDVDFGLSQGSEKVSVRILFDPKTEKVFYQWLTKDGSSKTATIQKLQRSIEENETMPPFSVETLEGDRLALEDFKGKTLVINWWATTCAPCLLEMPGLNEMVEKYKSRTDVEFIAIADNEKASLEKFLSKRDFFYQQTLSNAEVAFTFGPSWPKHIVVNPHGTVTFYLAGGNADIHEVIEKHLDSQLRSN